VAESFPQQHPGRRDESERAEPAPDFEPEIRASLKMWCVQDQHLHCVIEGSEGARNGMDRVRGVRVLIFPVADASGDERQQTGDHHQPPEPARGLKMMKGRRTHDAKFPVEFEGSSCRRLVGFMRRVKRKGCLRANLPVYSQTV